MSEKKYIFKIDHSKYFEKLNNLKESEDIPRVISSDFKITGSNCLCDKEIKLVENFKDYFYSNFGLALSLGAEYFTIVENKNVTDIAKDKYDLLRVVGSGQDLIIYFSDKDGNKVFNEYDHDTYQLCLVNIIEDFKNLYNAVSGNNIFLLETLTDDYIQDIAERLTGSQLEALIKHLTDDQLQAFAEHLTDSQLEALVDHLTNHQLQTFAQELNDTKLKIIIPILHEDQLAALVRGLNPGQLENILPHLKIDQFKVLINNIDDYQFMDLARNLSEHHLTILSKELGYNQLQILVNTLEEDKLKDLVNKLDHEKLTVIAQDLTDPSNPNYGLERSKKRLKSG